MSEWREEKLGVITSKIGSGATPTGGGNAYKIEGISLIRSQNVLDFRFVYYYFHAIKPELHSMAEIGCTRRALTKGMLEQLGILLPPSPNKKPSPPSFPALTTK